MYILLVLWTLVLALLTGSFQHNFTYLSYTNDYRWLYYIWFVLLATFIYQKLMLLNKKTQSHKQRQIRVLWIVFLIGGLLPYQLQENDVASNLHILFSIVPLLYTIVLLQYYIQTLVYIQFDSFIKLQNLPYTGCAFVVPLLMVTGSINILVEVYMILFVFYVMYHVEKALQ